MCGVGHGYGWLGGGRDGGCGWYACRTEGVVRMPGDAGALPECEVKTHGHPMTPPSLCVTLGRVESELVCLPGKILAQDATRRLQFVVDAAGWLHSMVLHGRSRFGSVMHTV